MDQLTNNEILYTIDIGVNFAGKPYNSENVKLIMSESKDCVKKIITISNNLNEILLNKKLCIDNENLYYTGGVHPHNAKSINKLDDLDVIYSLSFDSKFIAVGECGLDYNRMFTPKEKQSEVFDYQIKIAKKLNKPLYMHCRDAFDDFYQIIISNGYFNGVIHCFTGNKDQAKKLCDLGFYLGITGWLLDKRRNQELYEAIKYIPIEKILVETDAPWLSIDKSRKSHPLDTCEIVYEIARIKKMDPIKLGHQIYTNTVKLFSLTN